MFKEREALEMNGSEESLCDLFQEITSSHNPNHFNPSVSPFLSPNTVVLNICKSVNAIVPLLLSLLQQFLTLYPQPSPSSTAPSHLPPEWSSSSTHLAFSNLCIHRLPNSTAVVLNHDPPKLARKLFYPWSSTDENKSQSTPPVSKIWCPQSLGLVCFSPAILGLFGDHHAS